MTHVYNIKYKTCKQYITFLFDIDIKKTGCIITKYLFITHD